MEEYAIGRHAIAKSWRTNMDAAVKYGEWCKRTYRCRHFVDCRPHIQDYADWLVEQDKSPSTVHTYLAGVCRVFEVPLADIQKPKRVTSQNIRSRGLKNVDSRQDTKFEGAYKLRGANSQLARRLGRPTEYDRLAVLATSVFHLSHWRCDVTVSNYLLAY